jgi:hypothetical protein
MPRTRFIDHLGVRIVSMDFSGIQDLDTVLQVIEEARTFVAAQPRVKNLRTLVNVEGSLFGARGIEALKKLAVHDRPWVLAGAAVGMSGAQRIVYRVINILSGRQLAAFETAEEAKTWLAQQKP